MTNGLFIFWYSLSATFYLLSKVAALHLIKTEQCRPRQGNILSAQTPCRGQRRKNAHARNEDKYPPISMKPTKAAMRLFELRVCAEWGESDQSPANSGKCIATSLQKNGILLSYAAYRENLTFFTIGTASKTTEVFLLADCNPDPRLSQVMSPPPTLTSSYRRLLSRFWR